MLVGKVHSLWIGNETTEELKPDTSAICGFNLGSFESKAVAGILTGICMDDRAFFEEGPFHFAHYIVRLSC